MNPNAGIAAMPANPLNTKTAEIPRRMAYIDASLDALQNRLADLGIRISPALREASPPSDGTPPAQLNLPPSASQIEADLYNFNQRIEGAIACINHLNERIAL